MENIHNIVNVINEKIFQMSSVFILALILTVITHWFIIAFVSSNKRETIEIKTKIEKRKHSLQEKSNFNYIGIDKLYPDDPDFVENESWNKSLTSFYLNDKENRIKRSNPLYKGEDKLNPGDLLYFGEATKKKIIKEKVEDLKVFKDSFLKTN